jgi:hypothetical protein
MPNRALLVLIALGAASLGAACGQQAAATTQPKAPAGLSFSFDAQHGQLTASGYTMKVSPKAGSTSSVSGTVKVTLHITEVGNLANGTKTSCGAAAIGGEVDATTLTVDGGIETASAPATIEPLPTPAGITYWTCTLTIPYEWTLAGGAGADEGLFLVFAAAAVTPNGTVPRSSIQFNGVNPLPSNGSEATYSFNLTL